MTRYFPILDALRRGERPPDHGTGPLAQRLDALREAQGLLVQAMSATDQDGAPDKAVSADCLDLTRLERARAGDRSWDTHLRTCERCFDAMMRVDVADRSSKGSLSSGNWRYAGAGAVVLAAAGLLLFVRSPLEDRSDALQARSSTETHIESGRVILSSGGRAIAEVQVGSGLRPAIEEDNLEIWWTGAPGRHGLAYFVDSEGGLRGAGGGDLLPLEAEKARPLDLRSDDRTLVVLVGADPAQLPEIARDIGDARVARPLGSALIAAFDLVRP